MRGSQGAMRGARSAPSTTTSVMVPPMTAERLRRRELSTRAQFDEPAEAGVVTVVLRGGMLGS